MDKEKFKPQPEDQVFTRKKLFPANNFDTQIFHANDDQLNGEEPSGPENTFSWNEEEFEEKFGSGIIDSTALYLRQIGQTPLLTHEQEIELGRKVQAGLRAGEELASEDILDERKRELMEISRQGEIAAEHFVRANLRLSAKFAKRYARNGQLSYLDLVQEGNLGLMTAVKKFDPEKGYRFGTYAGWWLKQRMTTARSQQSRVVRLPANLSGDINRLAKIIESYTVENGEAPNREELESLFNDHPVKPSYTFEAVFTAFKDDMRKDALSLDLLMEETDENSYYNSGLLHDNSINVENDVIADTVSAEVLRKARDYVTEREWVVLVNRLGLDGNGVRTLEEIGQELKVTRERVRQIQDRAILKLRKQFVKE